MDTLDIVPKPTTCDCHFTQKNMKKEIQVMILKKEDFKLLIFGSSGHSNTLNMPPKILLIFSSSMERHIRPCLPHVNLSEMLIPSLEHLSPMHDAQLIWKSSCTMECSFGLSIWETSYACLGSLLMDNLDCVVKRHGFNNLSNK